MLSGFPSTDAGWEEKPSPELPVVKAAIARLQSLSETHGPVISRTAQLFAERVLQGGVIHVFGAGHSHMLAEELFFRAGGLLVFNALLDPGLMLHVSAIASGELERLPQYAHVLLGKYRITAGDALLVISYSGINPVPVEVALAVREKGAPVVALTSVEASRNSPARHPSGKRLYEVADLVIDNPGPPGDASLHLDGLDTPICALSTITGAALVQSLVYETTHRLLAAGARPPVLISGNKGDSDPNAALLNDYRDRLTHL